VKIAFAVRNHLPQHSDVEVKVAPRVEGDRMGKLTALVGTYLSVVEEEADAFIAARLTFTVEEARDLARRLTEGADKAEAMRAEESKAVRS
jgi:hypothetical protein